MGEAKRRKESDPNYGVKPQKLKQTQQENLILKQIKGMSKLELGMWTIFFGTSMIMVSWAFSMN